MGIMWVHLCSFNGAETKMSAIYVKKYDLKNGVTMHQYGMSNCKPCQAIAPQMASLEGIIGQPVEEKTISQDEFFETLPHDAKVPYFTLEKNGQHHMTLQTSNIMQLGVWATEGKKQINKFII